MSTLDKLIAARLADTRNTGIVRLVEYGKVVPEKWGYSMKPAYRIGKCCGVAMKGKPTYAQIWDRVQGKAKWDEDRLITIGFVGKTVKPDLGVGRQYLRFADGAKKDFIVSWRNA